jgi:hypothetical protein
MMRQIIILPFLISEKLKITEMPVENVPDGKRILAESGESKKGFEIVILPFDENGQLTKERILTDVPDMKIENEKEITIGNDIKALAFGSEDENLGPTFEIWFASGGHLFEARTYPEFGEAMKGILQTLKFR